MLDISLTLACEVLLTSWQLCPQIFVLTCFIFFTYLAVFDLQTVENCVCILRNLSYRLEEEVDRNKYLDTDLDPDRPDRTIYGGPDKTTAGFFSRKSKKKNEADREPADRAGQNVKDGVALLWQPETLSPLLTVLADSTIAETLEAAAGMIHNLTACSWRVSDLI